MRQKVCPQQGSSTGSLVLPLYISQHTGHVNTSFTAVAIMICQNKSTVLYIPNFLLYVDIISINVEDQVTCTEYPKHFNLLMIIRKGSYRKIHNSLVHGYHSISRSSTGERAIIHKKHSRKLRLVRSFIYIVRSPRYL